MKKEDEDALIGVGIALLLFLLKSGLPMIFGGGGGGKKEEDKNKPQEPDDGSPEPYTPPSEITDTIPVIEPDLEPEITPIYTEQPLPTPTPQPTPDYTPTTPPPIGVTPEPPTYQPTYTTPPAPWNTIPLPEQDYTTTPVDLIDTTIPYYTLITSGASVTPEVIAASEAAAMGAINVAETSALLGLGVGAAGVVAATIPAGVAAAAAGLALTGAAAAEEWKPNSRRQTSYSRRSRSRSLSRPRTSYEVTPAIQIGSTGFQQPIITSLFGVEV